VRPLGIRARSAVAIVALAVLLAVSAALMLHHLGRIQVDERRVLEESQEAALVQELAVGLDELAAVLQRPAREPLAAGDARAAGARVRSALDELRRLQAEDGQVSGAEHTAREDRLHAAIAATLEHVDVATTGGGAAAAAAGDRLREARATARAIGAETRAEAVRAHRDLERSVRASNGILLLTTGIGMLALLASWLWLWRSIVRPLAILGASAERFAAGDLAHRIPFARGDELGELAATFQRMADHLARDQQQLEAQVRERTEQLVRAARLADLGTLAAGLAHEINTPIASIASCAEGFARRLGNGGIAAGEQRELLQTIAAEAYRVKDITGRLLELARHEPGTRRRVELATLIGEIERLLHHSIAARGVTVRVLADEAWVEGNPGELKQVVLNLLANARDASPAGGTITVRCRRDGAEALVDVQDQGAGVAPELRENVFLPFFTTKPSGHGTGLGLALAARIAADHGGAVELLPAGPGATFRLRLPAAAVPA
jgi:signal transduction histidine kinase